MIRDLVKEARDHIELCHDPCGRCVDLLQDVANALEMAHPSYRCGKCGSKLYWSGKAGCIHHCMTCETYSNDW